MCGFRFSLERVLRLTKKMLKFLRKKTKVVIWAVLVTFVAWGGFAVSTQFQEANRSPGRIFGKEVSFQDYLMANRTVQIFAPAEEGNTPPDPEQIEARTWEFLVLAREARARKVRVTDEEVRDAVGQLLGQKKEFIATSNQYHQWVRSALREEPRDFENQVREHLRVRKLLEEVRKAPGENPEEGLKRWMLDLFQRARIEVYRPKT